MAKKKRNLAKETTDILAGNGQIIIFPKYLVLVEYQRNSLYREMEKMHKH